MIMSALFVLVTVSICVAGFFLIAFLWSVKNNQFEDQQGSAMRMLYDDEFQKEIFK
jgi:cbb3-type cytochrome oxidase maturation protein